MRCAHGAFFIIGYRRAPLRATNRYIEPQSGASLCHAGIPRGGARGRRLQRGFATQRAKRAYIDNYSLYIIHY